MDFAVQERIVFGIEDEAMEYENERQPNSAGSDVEETSLNAMEGTPKRGRRTADQSQARAIRARLVAWQRTPEQQRSSLRTLARALGTSHQLLSFYLKGLAEWQMRDYRRQATAIREQADAENRYLTPWEESPSLWSAGRRATHFAKHSAHVSETNAPSTIGRTQK
jgi:hypothetical protein